jgi:hypothetical protein
LIVHRGLIARSSAGGSMNFGCDVRRQSANLRYRPCVEGH